MSHFIRGDFFVKKHFNKLILFFVISFFIIASSLIVFTTASAGEKEEYTNKGRSLTLETQNVYGQSTTGSLNYQSYKHNIFETYYCDEIYDSGLKIYDHNFYNANVAGYSYEVVKEHSSETDFYYLLEYVIGEGKVYEWHTFVYPVGTGNAIFDHWEVVINNDDSTKMILETGAPVYFQEDSSYKFIAVFREIEGVYNAIIDIGNNAQIRNQIPLDWFTDNNIVFYKSFPTGTSYSEILADFKYKVSEGEFRPIIPHRPGYQFKTWNADVPGTKLIQNTIFSANWFKMDNVNIVVDASGGILGDNFPTTSSINWSFYPDHSMAFTIVPYDSVSYDDIGLDWNYTNLPFKEGFYFQGWNFPDFEDGDYVIENLKIDAAWITNPNETYKIFTECQIYDGVSWVSGGGQLLTLNNVTVNKSDIKSSESFEKTYDEDGNPALFYLETTNSTPGEEEYLSHYIIVKANEDTEFNDWNVSIDEGSSTITIQAKFNQKIGHNVVIEFGLGSAPLSHPDGWEKTSDSPVQYSKTYYFDNLTFGEALAEWNNYKPIEPDGYIFVGYMASVNILGVDVGIALEDLISNYESVTWTAYYQEINGFSIQVHTSSDIGFFYYVYGDSISDYQEFLGADRAVFDFNDPCTARGEFKSGSYKIENETLYCTYVMNNGNIYNAIYWPDVDGHGSASWKINGSDASSEGNLINGINFFTYNTSDDYVFIYGNVIDRTKDMDEAAYNEDFHVDIIFKTTDGSLPSTYITYMEGSGGFYLKIPKGVKGTLYFENTSGFFPDQQYDFGGQAILEDKDVGIYYFYKEMPAFGQILDSSNNPVKNAVVYFLNDDYYLFESNGPTDSSGNYTATIPYNFTGYIYVDSYDYAPKVVYISDQMKTGENLNFKLDEYVKANVDTRYNGAGHSHFILDKYLMGEKISSETFESSTLYLNENAKIGIPTWGEYTDKYALHYEYEFMDDASLDYYITPVPDYFYMPYIWWCNGHSLSDYSDLSVELKKGVEYNLDIEYRGYGRYSLTSNDEGHKTFNINTKINGIDFGTYNINYIEFEKILAFAEVSINENNDLVISYQNFDAGNYFYSNVKTINAIAKDGYEFVGWKINDQDVGAGYNHFVWLGDFLNIKALYKESQVDPPVPPEPGPDPDSVDPDVPDNPGRDDPGNSEGAATGDITYVYVLGLCAAFGISCLALRRSKKYN